MTTLLIGILVGAAVIAVAFFFVRKRNKDKVDGALDTAEKKVDVIVEKIGEMKK